MLDTFFLPTDTGDADIQIFRHPSTVTNLQWHTWLKPRGKTMCQIMCIGGGAGGGGGFTAAAAATRGGGGGGGSSGISRVTIPLFFLPDILYVQVGNGGLGRASGGGVATSGILSYVGIHPDTTASNILAISGAVAPVGGGTGTGAAVGAAGTAGTIAVIASMPLAGLGQFNLIAGQAGAAGGAQAGAIGPPATIPVTSCLTMGGGGGAGTTSADFSGSIITAITGSLLSTWKSNSAPGLAGTNSGASGYTIFKPFWSWCGLGGGASNTGAGGFGGDGGNGAGAGGGGGGTTGGTGGTGGPGIVIIMCW